MERVTIWGKCTSLFIVKWNFYFKDRVKSAKNIELNQDSYSRTSALRSLFRAVTSFLTGLPHSDQCK